MPLFTRRAAAAANTASQRTHPVFDWRVGDDDRAGPLPARRSTLRAMMPLLILLGCGGALYANPWMVAQTSDWLWRQVEYLRAPLPVPPARTETRLPSGEVQAATASTPTMAPSASGPLPSEAATSAAAAAPATPPTAPSLPATTASTAPSTAASAPGFNAPYAPPPPPAAETFQMRAEAVGLHPEMSKAVLTRLSASDLQNARLAIEKALSEPDEDAVVIWPKQRKSGEAQFRVHFVPGTDADCRRYVVAIAKDGWQSTALPMERCAGLAARPKSGP